MRRALWVVFMLSLAGTVFSGTLSYRELVGTASLSCPAPGAAGTVLGYPACIYGFVMFAAITVVSWLGLRAEGDAVTRIPNRVLPNG